MSISKNFISYIEQNSTLNKALNAQYHELELVNPGLQFQNFNDAKTVRNYHRTIRKFQNFL